MGAEGLRYVLAAKFTKLVTTVRTSLIWMRSILSSRAIITTKSRTFGPNFTFVGKWPKNCPILDSFWAMVQKCFDFGFFLINTPKMLQKSDMLRFSPHRTLLLLFPRQSLWCTWRPSRPRWASSTWLPGTNPAGYSYTRRAETHSAGTVHGGLREGGKKQLANVSVRNRAHRQPLGYDMGVSQDYP